MDFTSILKGIDFDAITYFKALLTTVSIWLIGSVVAIAVGIALGALTCKRTRIYGLSTLIEWAVVPFQCVPFFLQVYIAILLIPKLIGFDPGAFIMGAISLGLCSAAYICQVIRSGLDSLPKGQWDASKTLGYSKPQAMMNILLPQVVVTSISAISNELGASLRTSSVIAVLGVRELTSLGLKDSQGNPKPAIVYAVVLSTYIFLGLTLSRVARTFEKSMRNSGRFQL